jgi:hypothetical protein
MFRTRATPATVALLAFSLLGAAGVASALGLETFGIPAPGDVIKVLDALTRKDSDTSMEVKRGDTIREGKLLFARTTVEVQMDRSSRNWRGPVRVHMTVPSAVSYSIDLAAIRPEDVCVDPAKRLLTITMPEPRVEEVTPLLPELKSEETFHGCRFKRFDGDTSRTLQNAMLREDYQQRARKEGEAHLPEFREQARSALRDLLEGLLRPGCPQLKVRVD